MIADSPAGIVDSGRRDHDRGAGHDLDVANEGPIDLLPSRGGRDPYRICPLISEPPLQEKSEQWLLGNRVEWIELLLNLIRIRGRVRVGTTQRVEVAADERRAFDRLQYPLYLESAPLRCGEVFQMDGDDRQRCPAEPSNDCDP